MKAKLPTPTNLERQMAEPIAAALTGGATAEQVDLVAGALAHHRCRLTALALALLPAAAGPSEQTIERMADGWTPRQVHELISAHRALLLQLRRAREILPAALGNGGAP